MRTRRAEVDDDEGCLRNNDLTLGKLSFATGALTMLLALAWGGAFLRRLRGRLQAP